MNRRFSITFVLLVIILLIPSICIGEGQAPDQELKIIYSSSLGSQVTGLIEQFSKNYPEITIDSIPFKNTTEIIQSIRTDNLEYDLILVPDYTLLEKNLIPEYHSWDIRYGYCRMVLAYTSDSKYVENITPVNWFEILAKDEVSWGMINPEDDSLGWRSLISIGLSDTYYEKPVFESLIDPTTNISRESAGDTEIITVFKPYPAGNLHFSNNMNELGSQVREGTIDYAWMYQGGAYQNNLSWIILPEEIDLSTSRYRDQYSSIVVMTPSGIWHSPPIVFSISIPDNAKNQKTAIAFITMLTDHDGTLVLSHLGQESLKPAEGYGKVPDELADLILIS